MRTIGPQGNRSNPTADLTCYFEPAVDFGRVKRSLSTLSRASSGGLAPLEQEFK